MYHSKYHILIHLYPHISHLHGGQDTDCRRDVRRGGDDPQSLCSWSRSSQQRSHDHPSLSTTVSPPVYLLFLRKYASEFLTIEDHPSQAGGHCRRGL